LVQSMCPCTCVCPTRAPSTSTHRRWATSESHWVRACDMTATQALTCMPRSRTDRRPLQALLEGVGPTLLCCWWIAQSFQMASSSSN
jgi:hypothetical protein